MKSKYSVNISYLIWIFIPIFLLFHVESKSEVISHQAIVEMESMRVTEIEMQNGKSYTKVELPNSLHNVTPGKPDIPYLEYCFLVPDGAGNFAVSISNVEVCDSIKLPLPLIPAQLCWSLNDLTNKPWLDNDTEFYNTHTPISRGEVLDVYYVNAKNLIVKVGVPVMDYNPSTQMTYLYSNLEFDLYYEDGVSPTLGLSDQNPNKEYNNLDELVVNPPKPPVIKKEKSYNPLSLHTPEWYYIITPNLLLSAAENIGKWKKQKGYNVEIVTVEEILSSSAFHVNGITIVDDAESVRKWLIEERKKVGSFYLLFIGDSRVSSPMRKLRYSHDYKPDSINWISGQFIPTDGYFSDVTTDYKLTREIDGHYSAFVEKVTFSPDLYVGRILASKNHEINTYFDKLLTYELLPNYSIERYGYLNKGLVTKQYQHKDYTSLFDGAKVLDVSILRDENGFTNFTQSTPVGEDVIGAMAESGLISLMGHGNPTTIACSGGTNYPDPNPITGKKELASEDWRYIQSINSYGSDLRWIKRDEPNNGLDLMKNRGKPSVVYSLSCDVMPFDSLFNVDKKIGYLPYNMAEAFTIGGQFGGVAFIGNTRTGWDNSTRIMELNFGRQINNSIPIGKAFNHSSLSITQKYAQYARNIIGDPELKIWINEPIALNMDVNSDSNGVIISGSDIADSKVAVYNGIEGISYEVENSATSILFKKSEYGNDFLVSIFKDHHVPALYLFAHNSILNIPKSYILKDTKLNGESVFCYQLENHGQLTLHCIERLQSNKGFKINSGGRVTIQCKGVVDLSNDRVNEGGVMKIDAKNIEIGPGFVITKGGSLTFRNS